MRVCCECKIAKPLDQFSFRNKTNGTRGYQCKLCWNFFNRNRYRSDSGYYKTKAEKSRAINTKIKAKLVLAYLQEHPCVDCGEKDPVVLDFDHQHSKLKTIGVLVNLNVSWDKIAAEITKCEVRCANCHRRKTAKEQSWFKYLAAVAQLDQSTGPRSQVSRVQVTPVAP